MKNPKCIKYLEKVSSEGVKNQRQKKKKSTDHKTKANVNKHYRTKKYNLLCHQLQINHIFWALIFHLLCTQWSLLRCHEGSWGKIEKTLCLISLSLKYTEKHVICKGPQNIQLGVLHFIKQNNWFPWEGTIKRENRGQWQMLIL